METNPNQRDVVVTRLFDAPVERVWRAWIDPEDVMRWWGPDGFTSPLAKMDFREGGTSLVCMRAPVEYGGQDMYHTWTYQKIEPHHRIEFIARFSDQDGHTLDPADLGIPPGVPIEVYHVITFWDAGEGRTEMTVREQSYSTDIAHDTSKAGLEQCLDKLAAIFTQS